jgi:hypothetical protein
MSPNRTFIPDFALSGFPLTTAWTLLVFVLLPESVQRELERKRGELSPNDMNATAMM